MKEIYTIKDNINIKELEKYHYKNYEIGNSDILYYKLVPENRMLITILRNKRIDFELPIFSKLNKKDINLKEYIKDLIDNDLIIKEE